MSTISSDGTPIYYETNGQGPTIVFAHGAGGNAASWFNQVAHFSPDYQVIAFDHRGFGRTPVGAEALTASRFRDDLLAILDAEGVDRAHLVGQSMGGFTVLRTALDAPERVRSLTMSATHGGLPNPNPTPAMKSLTGSSDNDTSGISATMSEATKQRPEIMRLYESIANFNVDFNWSNLARLLGPECVVQLADAANVKCPTLFVCGNEDPLFPPDLLASYVPHFSDATMEIVANAGHSPYFEQADAFNALLTGHLERASSA
jgi:pimeloyl-ACP methyl ester carboxylesterase